MPRTIDLNADLGEGFPWDRALLDRVTSASICCGAHAGDPETIVQTLRWAEERGVIVGAHPGYADRAGFGRRELSLGSTAILGLVRRQVDDLTRQAEEAGTTLRFVKPHGALYNQAQRDGSVAIRLLTALSNRPMPILGLPGGEVERRANLLHLPFISEGFVDRRYLPDGRLVPRTEPGANLRDPDAIRAQVLSLVARGIQTLCIHGDDPRSVELADLVLATLSEAGIQPEGFA
jgi:UPF0271 protein